MKDIVIYTTTHCGYCHAAKSLLDRRGIAYREVDITGNHHKRRELLEATRRRTVPNIFIDGEAIGGYQELAKLLRQLDQSSANDNG